jgi:hypothetical protein
MPIGAARQTGNREQGRFCRGEFSVVKGAARVTTMDEQPLQPTITNDSRFVHIGDQISLLVEECSGLVFSALSG